MVSSLPVTSQSEVAEELDRRRSSSTWECLSTRCLLENGGTLARSSVSCWRAVIMTSIASKSCLAIAESCGRAQPRVDCHFSSRFQVASSLRQGSLFRLCKQAMRQRRYSTPIPSKRSVYSEDNDCFACLRQLGNRLKCRKVLILGDLGGR